MICFFIEYTPFFLNNYINNMNRNLYFNIFNSYTFAKDAK